MRRFQYAFLVLLLSGCSNEANHLGNPVLWPVTLASTALSNAAYDNRRAKVAAYVDAHQPAILADAAHGSGRHLDAATALAQVPANRRADLIRELAQNPLYRQDRSALVVALMVHGA